MAAVNFAALLALTLLALFCYENAAALPRAKPKKNVLLMFADDAGFMQSAYNRSTCDTPNLDKLASRSVVINRGYTSVSSCSPSRSVLLTGLPQHQNGMYGLQHGVHHFQSYDKVRSLPVILQDAGIYTGIIGKYHVAPREVYDFEYFQTQPLDQVGRNITCMKEKVKEFLSNAKQSDKPFFLYLAIHDTHRCTWSPTDVAKHGLFYDIWGDGEMGHGRIPDWKPIKYDPKDVTVPYYLPDTPKTRADIAAMYTGFNRMDQGIGLFMKELEDAGFADDTLVMFTSDNGIPFPNAKTNLYEPGQGEPMMISSPLHKEHWGKHTDRFGSTMDFTPTVLDWFGVKYPKHHLNGVKVELTGKSLLPLAANPSDPSFDHAFSSHDFHEVTMPYPMRVMRTDRYRLIHNLNYRMAYPMATDIYSSPTFRDILDRSAAGEPTNWFKTLDQYYYRDEWELYDLQADPHELNNLADDPAHNDIVKQMNQTLFEWQEKTNDPWRCLPHSILLGHLCYDMRNQKKP